VLDERREEVRAALQLQQQQQLPTTSDYAGEDVEGVMKLIIDPGVPDHVRKQVSGRHVPSPFEIVHEFRFSSDGRMLAA